VPAMRRAGEAIYRRCNGPAMRRACLAVHPARSYEAVDRIAGRLDRAARAANPGVARGFRRAAHDGELNETA
jgi:hypothetical protein